MSSRLVRLAAVVVVVKILGHVALALSAVRYKQSAPPPPDPSADEIELVTVMDGSRFASTASAFRGGRIVSWYAGTDVDLRDATLDPAGARLEVRTAFGGTRIFVAPGVPVGVRVPAIFGGTANVTGATPPSVEVPGIEIGGFTVLGGLQVIAAEPGAGLSGWSGNDAEEGRTVGDAEPLPALDVEPDVAPA